MPQSVYVLFFVLFGLCMCSIPAVYSFWDACNKMHSVACLNPPPPKSCRTPFWVDVARVASRGFFPGVVVCALRLGFFGRVLVAQQSSASNTQAVGDSVFQQVAEEWLKQLPSPAGTQKQCYGLLGVTVKGAWAKMAGPEGLNMWGCSSLACAPVASPGAEPKRYWLIFHKNR